MASHIGRRKFLAMLGGAAVTWPLAARAQQGERVRRIGVLMYPARDDPEGQARIAAFLDSLEQLGWTDGRNVRIDIRWPAGFGADRVRQDASELVAAVLDVILATGNYSNGAAATVNPDRANRICGDCGPRQRGLRREHGTAGRQYYRLLLH